MKNKKYQFSIIGFIGSLLLLLFLFLLEENEVYLQLGAPSGGVRSYQINSFLIIILLISFVYLVHYKLNKAIITVISTIVACIIFSSLIFIYVLYLGDVDYTTFSSPDKREHFVVAERYSGEIFHLSNSGLFMKKIGTIDSDGYKPFLQDDYYLEWISPNELLISYSVKPSSILSPSENREIKVKYKPSK